MINTTKIQELIPNGCANAYLDTVKGKRVLNQDTLTYVGLGKDLGNHFYIRSDEGGKISSSKTTSCGYDIEEKYVLVAQSECAKNRELALLLSMYVTEDNENLKVTSIQWNKQKILKEETGECKKMDQSVVKILFTKLTSLSSEDCIDACKECC